MTQATVAPNAATRIARSTRDKSDWTGTTQNPRQSSEQLSPFGWSVINQTGWRPADVPAGIVHSYRPSWSHAGNFAGSTGTEPVAEKSDSHDDLEFVIARRSRLDPEERASLWQRTFLTGALAAVSLIAKRHATEEIVWMDAAQRLRSAAVTGRARAPRHAAIALILGDALTFTDAAELSENSWGALLQGVVALQEPFVSAERERALIHSLLSGGWSITGPFNADLFSTLAPDLFE